MPNIGAVLKEEISRLSRREIRRQVESMKRASTQYRRHIAALRREVSRLRQQISLLVGRVLKGAPAASPTATAAAVRFVPNGLRAHRQRLGLSASDYGRLAGVSPQTIYNWEQGTTKPSEGRRAMLATLRKSGKREALARLEQLRGKGARRNRKR